SVCIVSSSVFLLYQPVPLTSSTSSSPMTHADRERWLLVSARASARKSCDQSHHVHSVAEGSLGLSVPQGRQGMALVLFAGSARRISAQISRASSTTHRVIPKN